MKVRQPGGFAPGLPVTVCLSGGLKANGIVRRSVDDRAGIELSGMLTFDQLASVAEL